MKECKVIAICNQKGEIGKSALANALSIGLARKEYKVLLVDSVKLAECKDVKNIYEYDKNGKGVQAYLSFIAEFLERMGAVNE